MNALRKPVMEALALGCIASLSVGCVTASGAETTKGASLPASVRGVPMLELAKHALGAAEAYLRIEAVQCSSRDYDSGGSVCAGPNRWRIEGPRVRRDPSRSFHMWALRHSHAHFDYDHESFNDPRFDDGAPTTHSPCQRSHDGSCRSRRHSRPCQAGPHVQSRPIREVLGRSQRANRASSRLGDPSVPFSLATERMSQPSAPKCLIETLSRPCG